MSRFSSILGSLSDTRAEALNDATREKNWEGSLEDSATDLIRMDIQKMREEDALRIAKRKERQRRKEEERAEAEKVFREEVFSSEGEEEPLLQEFSESAAEEVTPEFVSESVAEEDVIPELVSGSVENTMDSVVESDSEDTVEIGNDLPEKDIDERKADVFSDWEESRSVRRRECIYKVPSVEGMTAFRRQIENRRIYRLVNEIYRTDENSFKGRRMIFELLEELFETEISVTDFHTALEDFHMQYDVDRGDRWMKTERENPMSQWGRKWLPFPTKEQIDVLLSWGYQEDGSFVEPES